MRISDWSSDVCSSDLQGVLPREILPLSTVGANLVHFFLQTLVLLAALVIFRYDVAFEYLWLVIPALAVLLVLAAGFGILFAALNVYARDLQHLLELVMLAWFWLTPIVYAWQLPADKLSESGLSTRHQLPNPLGTHGTKSEKARV